MELRNRNATESQPLVPKEKAPMALEEDFSAIFGSRKLNGDQFIGPAVRAANDSPNKMTIGSDKPNPTLAASDKANSGAISDKPNTMGVASDKPGPRAPGDLGPLMDDPDPGAQNTNDDDFIMKEKNLPEKDDDVAISIPDADDYHDGLTDDPDDRGSQVSGVTNRFGDTDNVDGAAPPAVAAHDDKVDADEEKKSDFNNVKHLTQGMMDVALLSANANQLRTVLESSNVHPYYVSSIVLISLSLFCQVAVGITLIMDYQFHLTNQPQKAKTASRFSMFGIFLIIIINVFIAAFSVATPVVYRAAPAVGGTGLVTTT